MDPARLARVAALALALTISGGARAQPTPLVLVVDSDDDDGDGRADRAQPTLSIAARRDVVSLDPSWKSATFAFASGAEHVRAWDGAKPYVSGKKTTDFPSLQGVAPGVVEIDARLAGGKTAHERVLVWGLELRDREDKPIAAATDHVALARTPPSRDPAADDDAVTVLVTAPDDTFKVAPSVSVESLGASGVRLDELSDVPLTASAACAAGHACFRSGAIRLALDDVDRSHPFSVGHALRAEVGGGIVLRAFGRKQVVRVGGPRASAVGPISRMRVSVRPIVLRITPGGAAAIGGNDAAAAATIRGDLAVASSIWGQCGLSLGDTSSIDVRIVDPPPPHLLALGDGSGFATSGGELRLAVDGKAVSVTLGAAWPVDRVAREAQAALVRAGFVPVVTPNARAASSALASVDVSVRHRDGSLATLTAQPNGPLTTDATLDARIGSVELSSGLEHFNDDDSPLGTLQERTLVKALDDGDPGTVELLVVPFFAGTGRIGESFIASESPSMRSVVILDRGGIRARRTSLTLAHELGHVLLGIPGHPDDYGEDTPTRLLDSDASDASAFGPKRITLGECERAIRESGPTARVPLLSPWPLVPLTVR